eukprot:TRINITY_DN50595_c0_g1_i1.p1 TRINITY_DN50595_c0_g1~~TRINITY_DN50595_c0_g1_i1.p1  ORF type:complete len:133 (-),score=26.43 TRINITY_DN50595_c0_g1_i1:126-524(-)
MLKKVFVLMCSLALCTGEYDLDEMAASTCAGLSVGHGKTGHVVAIRRQCSTLASDCNAVCQSAPAFRTDIDNFSCFDSLHVYKSRPSLGERTGLTVEHTAPAGEGQYGPVIFRFGSCTGSLCGANYCCCIDS